MHKGVPATSNPQGTTLPRSGVFWGMRAPQYYSAIVSSELAGSTMGETEICGWIEPHQRQTEQTGSTQFQANRLKLANFEIDLHTTSTGIYENPTSSQFLTGSFSQVTTVPVIRDVDVAYAFIPEWDDLTESPWRRLRHALEPLHAVSDAILENIHARLEQDVGNSGESRHVGLTAVARLTRLLELSRPMILRMGGVPESTFYAWQKNPQSIVRTPSVIRLLRLQAQIGILDEALGREGMRAWLLSGDRVNKLQGENATFAQVLTEAEEALTDATRIAVRPRIRLEDYEFRKEQPGGNSIGEVPSWPGATKITEEPAE
jgi:hypothetical protein